VDAEWLAGLRGVTTVVGALRPKQWAKNGLLFVALAFTLNLQQPALLARTLAAFVLFCALSSSGYLLNDVRDVEADRAHPTKKKRPIASGDVSPGIAVAIGLILVLAGFTLEMGTSMRATLLLSLYVILNVAYSRLLKEYAIIDVLLLASFYTLRILVGGAAANIVLTTWLLAFSMFTFFSLALAKRVSELQGAQDRRKARSGRRGYQVEDLTILTIMGACAGELAVLVFALYLNSGEMSRLYKHPDALWYLCLMVFYWVSRLWLSVHREEVHEDPVIFTLRDPGSYVCVVLAAVVLYFSSG
jgi:4-hydroxybenzoate polyprenyltransferase